MTASNVIEIGDFSIERRNRYEHKKEDCPHDHVSLKKGDIVECRDCNRQVSAFWAFEKFAAKYNDWNVSHNRDVDRHHKQVKKDLHLLAARYVEEAWRSQTMVPTCPHCSEPIFAEDRFGSTMVNKKIALARRKAAGGDNA